METDQFVHMQLETVDYTSNSKWFRVTSNGAVDRDMVRNLPFKLLPWSTYSSQRFSFGRAN